MVDNIASLVARDDERFVDFIKILFYILFSIIKTINIRLSSNLQISHHPAYFSRSPTIVGTKTILIRADIS